MVRDWLNLWAAELARDRSDMDSLACWRSTYGHDGFDKEIHRPWQAQVKDTYTREFLSYDPSIKNSLMVRRIDDLSASKTSELVLLPLQDTYLHRLSAERLVMSTATLREDELWADVLSLL